MEDLESHPSLGFGKKKTKKSFSLHPKPKLWFWETFLKTKKQNCFWKSLQQEKESGGKF